VLGPSHGGELVVSFRGERRHKKLFYTLSTEYGGDGDGGVIKSKRQTTTFSGDQKSIKWREVKFDTRTRDGEWVNNIG